MIKLISVLAIISVFRPSSQQIWNNVKPWDPRQMNGLGTLIASKIDRPSKSDASKLFTNPQAPTFYRPVPPSVPIQIPAGPYLIQQQTITSSGETIIENLIGGIPFDCSTRPTGHWRDSIYCDIFHACVFGQQKKTYSCPFVGEHTYFDDYTHKCEFVRANPSGCSSNAFLH